jgi:hypothetical protein
MNLGFDSSPRLSGWLKLTAACGLLFAIAGCAPVQMVASANIPPVAPNAARVWFYQDGSPSDGLGVALITLNGYAVGQSQVNSSFYRDVAPGQYHVSLQNPVNDLNQTADISLAPGQTAYIKIATLDNWAMASGSQRGGGARTTFYVWPQPPAVGSAAVAYLPLLGG